ncbi:MAG: NAD(P)-dependent oxidoreductase [Myxococcota bacterium]|nr:NAD(P)-dependent oxidoreductase [Myxococcota bacterium]
MPTLVTGASGFLGRALCPLLTDAGHAVVGVQRTRPVPPGVQPLLLPAVPDNGPELAAWIHESRPARVLHLGSPVNPARDPALWEEMQTGVLQTTAHIARACAATDTPLVLVSTCEVYGDGPAPFHESQRPQPVSPYSAAKAAAELWVSTLARTQGLRALILRPFLAYGPHQERRGLVPAAVRAAVRREPFPMTAGAQTRELNHVQDLARGIAMAAESGLWGHTLNLCGGPELPVLQIVQRIFDLAGADRSLIMPGALPTRSGEVARFCGDPSLCASLLGYQPRIDLDAGLRACIDAERAA